MYMYNFMVKYLGGTPKIKFYAFFSFKIWLVSDKMIHKAFRTPYKSINKTNFFFFVFTIYLFKYVGFNSCTDLCSLKVTT